MDDVFVGSLMSAPVHGVGPDETVQSAARAMLERGIGSLVVVDDSDRLEGILTATDFVQAAADDVDTSTTPVADYMSEDVATATVNETVTSVADRIVTRGFHHLPVVDGDDAVIGIVTTTDLTAYVSGVREPSPHAGAPTE